MVEFRWVKKGLLLFLIIFLAGIYFLFSNTLKTPELEIEVENVELTGEYDEFRTLATFHGKNMTVPPHKESEAVKASVLGTKSEDTKRIEVDLTNQKLYAYEGKNKVYNFTISTGKWGRTPTGEFRIWTKYRYVLMSGGSQELGTYYYLPNVPFTMFFYNSEVSKSLGYGIHGTYWHDNFGYPMSHGCINMKTEEAEKLFYWANPVLPKDTWSVYADDKNTGTKVVIYGEAPPS